MTRHHVAALHALARLLRIPARPLSAAALLCLPATAAVAWRTPGAAALTGLIVVGVVCTSDWCCRWVLRN